MSPGFGAVLRGSVSAAVQGDRDGSCLMWHTPVSGAPGNPSLARPGLANGSNHSRAFRLPDPHPGTPGCHRHRGQELGALRPQCSLPLQKTLPFQGLGCGRGKEGRGPEPAPPPPAHMEPLQEGESRVIENIYKDLCHHTS